MLKCKGGIFLVCILRFSPTNFASLAYGLSCPPGFLYLPLAYGLPCCALYCPVARTTQERAWPWPSATRKSPLLPLLVLRYHFICPILNCKGPYAPSISPRLPPFDWHRQVQGWSIKNGHRQMQGGPGFSFLPCFPFF